MTKKILMAGFACWSVMAVAQASGSKDQAASTAKNAHPKEVASGQASGNVAAPKDLSTGHSSGKAAQPAGSPAVLNSSDAAASQPVQAPRDMATGQSSGKRQYAPVIIRKVSDDDAVAAREQQSPKATGKVMASDDWHTTAKTNSNVSVPPADLDGDGKADRASNAASSNANGQARVAKGDVNGDGKADGTKTPSSSTNGQARVAAADVNGDGKADSAINTSHSNIKNASDATSGQANGNRVHQDITINKHNDATPQK